MTNVLIAILLLYNMWLVFYLLHERRQGNNAGQPAPPEQPKPDTDIVGRSLFRMPKVRTTGDTAVPQAAITPEGEAVAESDVTFADEMTDRQGENAETEGQSPMRLPDDRIEDAFSDTRLSGIPAEYADEDSGETGEYASGATIEEMNDAVRTADNPKASDSEKVKAGEVLHEMKGNSLYEVLTAKKPGIINRIQNLIDLYEDKATARQVIPENIPAVEGLDGFDIRDFV